MVTWKKRSTIYFSLIICIFIVSSCKSNKPKIGFLVSTFQLSRYQKEAKFFTKNVEALGGETIVVSADNNDNLQINQASDLIKQGVSVIVLNAVNLNTAGAIVREANKKNVKVIAYDRLIKNCNLDYYITFDNEKVGILMAEYFIKKKPKGNYILIGGDKSDQNAVWVKSGQLKVLDSQIKSGDIHIDYDTYIEDWSADNARFAVKKILNLSEEIPDAILSSNDGMATGIINEISERGLAGKILISGQDADIDACRNIVAGYQSMTVYKPIRALALKASDMAIKLCKGQNVEENLTQISNGEKMINSVLLQPLTVDANNMKSVIVADGVFSEKEIYFH